MSASSASSTWSALTRALYDERLTRLAELGRVPDALIRAVIRQGLRSRRAELAGSPESMQDAQRAFLASMRLHPLALSPERANEQHYEVPPAFFERVLGPRLKYSACHFGAGTHSLARAEEEMLALTCERAGIVDGMRVLDLGCGWGSLSLWIAEHYPNCRVTALSNSKPQGEFIRRRCSELGVDGLSVETADMNAFEAPQRFDRIVSVEMFEHMRNWELLLSRIARWLQPDGRLFAHFFCHREYAYPYETDGGGNWMGRHFFTGGMMPSDRLILEFQDDLRVEERWRVGGRHYQRTSEAWLENLDASREALLPVLADTYGEESASRWFGRWRLFFLACAELFGFAGGREWWVSHVRLAPRAAR
jgi:cyclopropane-fatty-acyl-phospholipid synthase